MPLEAMRALIGNEISVSGWIAIEQDRIARFGEATDDFAAVHLDREAARAMGSMTPSRRVSSRCRC